MNISKTTLTEKPPFQPYNIIIKVETERDHEALLKLSKAQYQIPELLYPYNSNPVYFNKTTDILNSLMKAILL